MSDILINSVTNNSPHYYNVPLEKAKDKIKELITDGVVLYIDGNLIEDIDNVTEKQLKQAVMIDIRNQIIGG